MSAALQQPTRPAPAAEDVRTLNERIAHTGRVITRLYELLREYTEGRQALIESRDALLTKRDNTFLNLMEEPGHADALAEALTGDAPLPDKLAAGMRLVQDDDDDADNFGQATVRQATLEAAELMAVARAEDPDCAAAPLTATERAARDRKEISYEMTCADCGREFRAAIPARHCPACVAAAYQRESGDGSHPDDPNYLDAGGDA